MYNYSHASKPASNGISFAVIGVGLVMALYSILALPGYGNGKPNLVTALRDMVKADFSISAPARAAKPPAFKL